jgi:DNA-binding beta-propeller fold protein YncE
MCLICPAAFAVPPQAGSTPQLLPTGVSIMSAGQTLPAGNMPLNMVVSPDGRYAVLSLNGWREQGIQIIDLQSFRVQQTIPLEAAFYGLCFSKSGDTLYVAGGFSDSIEVFSFHDGNAKLTSSISLPHKQGPTKNKKEGGEKESQESTSKGGASFPAGLALSPDGKSLYVAENVADDLAVLDVTSGKLLQRLPTEHYPYAVLTAADGSVYVSAWGGSSVSVFRPATRGELFEVARLEVGRHPSAMVLDGSGKRLYVACASTDSIVVINTNPLGVVTTFDDHPPRITEGSTPSALALSNDGTTLFVAEADNNAVAVFQLSDAKPHLLGRVPVEWYPTAVAVTADKLYVVNGKGHGAGPNPNGPRPGETEKERNRNSYVLGQLNGSVTALALPIPAEQMAGFSESVAANNNWNKPEPQRSYPPFKHVVYIIKENRTYDQVFGDLPGGDGDSKLVFFPREITPNQHALAERFGIYDRFLTNSEVSFQGHMWATAAYVTDYTEKTTPEDYAHKRPEVDEGDVENPAVGFLWTAAARKGIWFRVYGEFTAADKDKDEKTYHPTKPGMDAETMREFPTFDMDIPDQKRADLWLSELRHFEELGQMPALEIIWLPRDHTAGGKAKKCTPRACVADNDFALGRMIEGLSRSTFWKDTLVLVVEDDAQNGSDHLDSHRAPVLLISAYNHAGVNHTFFNQTDVVAAIEDVLGLGRLSKFDLYSRSLSPFFQATADPSPYKALPATISLTELNPEKGEPAKKSSHLDLSEPDKADDAELNAILWEIIKGKKVPYPPVAHLSTQEQLRAK